MKLINEQEIYNTWAPLIESKAGITDESKKGWLTKYCHYHSLNESAGAYNTLGVVNGMGSVAPPVFPGMSNFSPGVGQANAGFYNTANQGSGDKFPSLLPLAIQVAAKTVGFDIVPVIPMSGPTGILSYLDYVYAGGKLAGATSGVSGADLADAPAMIKFAANGGTGSIGITAGVLSVASSSTAINYFIGTPSAFISAAFVGLSRIDGSPIFKIQDISNGYNVAQIVTTSPTAYVATSSGNLTAGAATATVTSTASLVKALEDHIQGFSGAGFNNTDPYQGPYVDGTKTYNPMLRGVGESTYYQSMGLSTFTKFVEAETFQVAASVTTEQIQDLNKQFGIDVISMIENALVNEVSQSINKHILSRGFALGWSNHTQFTNVEGQNLNLNLSTSAAAATAAYVNKSDVGVSMAVPGVISTGTFENQSTLQRRLFSRILAAANVVANRGRRGPANFLVTNAYIASALQDISQFTFAPFSNTLTQNNGTLYPVGSLAGMTVYVDQNMNYADTRILVGRKGGDDEPGLKFMPYMMAESIQTISEGTMSPKIAVKSRYALVEAGFLPETMYFTFFVNLPANGIV